MHRSLIGKQASTATTAGNTQCTARHGHPLLVTARVFAHTQEGEVVAREPVEALAHLRGRRIFAGYRQRFRKLYDAFHHGHETRHGQRYLGHDGGHGLCQHTQGIGITQPVNLQMQQCFFPAYSGLVACHQP